MKPDPAILRILADLFCGTPLPAGAIADPCATDPSCQHRSGTNLMGQSEAEEFLGEILDASGFRLVPVDARTNQEYIDQRLAGAPSSEQLRAEAAATSPEQREKTIYIAGPMRGHFMFNFPAFDQAAAELKRQGWNVLNPADLDRQAGFDPKDLPLRDYDWNDLEAIGFDLKDAMERDIEAITKRAGAIALLPGWEKSTGSQAELALARWAGLKVYLLPSMTRLDEESVLEEAIRLTGGDRQKDYGSAAKDFARTAKLWSALKGTHFEPKEVAMFMVCVKLSREVHKSKRDNWTDIAGYAECGSQCG